VAQAFDLAGMAKSARCQECSAVFSWREAICDAISANHKLEAIDLDQKSQL